MHFLSYHDQSWQGTHESALLAYHDCIYNPGEDANGRRTEDSGLSLDIWVTQEK